MVNASQKFIMMMERIRVVKVKDGFKFIVMVNLRRVMMYVRVYQLGGDTKTIQPGWKLFRVDRMNGLRKLGGQFYEPKPLFNPNGDKDMIQIYNILNFD
jgi:hypothetical protein